MREGDIYRWSWKEGVKTIGDQYHARARVAIVVGGALHDIFWMHHGSKFVGGGWGPSPGQYGKLDIEMVNLTLVANMDDLMEICPGTEIDYTREDVVDLRHSNNTSAPVYVRVGAKRNQSVMLERVRREREECVRAIKYAEFRMQRLDDAETRILAGDLDVSGI